MFPAFAPGCQQTTFVAQYIVGVTQEIFARATWALSLSARLRSDVPLSMVPS